MLRPSSLLPGCCQRQRTAVISAAAKDKKGSKKGVSALAGLLKKKAEAEGIEPVVPGQRATPAQYADAEVRGLLFALTSSYYKATKKFLVDGVDLSQLPEAIYHADMCVLVHDRFQEGVTDPQFIYANKASLELFEANWEQMIGMPSRLSAGEDPAAQEDRQALLDQAAESNSGFVENYEGWRVSLTGKRFMVKDVTLLNVLDFSGEKMGQAAVFNKYQLENGTEVQVTSEAWQPAQLELPPSEEDIAASEAWVELQAGTVRDLKENQGLPNTDPQVQAAVLELKTRKEYLAGLHKKVADVLAAAEAAFSDDTDDD